MKIKYMEILSKSDVCMKKEEENDGRKYFSFYFYRTFYRNLYFFGETTIFSFIKKEFIIIFSNQLNENNTISNIII